MANPAQAGAAPVGTPPFSHPLFGAAPVRAQLALQPADDELRTAHTVGLMARYAREDSRHPLIRRAALEAIRDLRQRNPRQEAGRVWRWIRDRVQFIEDRDIAALAGIRDADETEVLIRPVDLVTMPEPSGDCDDYSMLTASMLRALGIPSAFRAIAADASQPDTYSHVYVVAFIDGQELVLDASHGPRPGWEAPAAGKVRTWRIDEMDNGLGLLDPTTPAWQRWVDVGVNAAANIATTRFAQPPAGTFVSGPQGTFYRQRPDGAAPSLPIAAGGSMLPWLLAGVVVLVLLARK